jgi:predicted nucleic acid-binding protein
VDRPVILVDSSVWIDYFRGDQTLQTDKLDALLKAEPIGMGDLTLAEVLQGFNREQDFNRARKLLTPFVIVELAGADMAIQATRNFRAYGRGV